MRLHITTLLLAGLAIAAPLSGTPSQPALETRQIAMPGSPESYAEASSIIGGLAKGLKGSGIPLSDQISQFLQSVADGLSKAGTASPSTSKPALKVRQITVPAPGSPESFQQASSIITALANGLKGSGIPLGDQISQLLGSLGKGLGDAAPAGSKSAIETRQVSVPAPGSPESFQQASSIITALANGLKGSGIPLGDQISQILGSLGKGLGEAAPAKPAGSKSAIETRQLSVPAAGSPDSFRQASSIIGALGKGLRGSGIPLGDGIAQILESLAKGIEGMGAAV